MEYYYTQKKNIKENELVIEGDDVKHLYKVLRRKSGDVIRVTDGKRNLYKSVIECISKDSVNCRIIEKSFNINEPDINITLYQSMLKNPARFEFVIEKSVELGIYEIQPIVTEHVINKKSDKADRWQSIAIASMKQSQRCYLPKVNHPKDFAEIISVPGKDDLKIIADERIFSNTIHANELGTIINKNRDVSVFIGPEGGFTDEETESAVNAGFVTVNIGARKYRSETAAIALLSIMLIKH